MLALPALSGCETITGWFGDDEYDPTAPVELKDIQQQIKFSKRWSKSIGDGQGDGLYKFTPVLVGNLLYVASADGDVFALNAETGKVRWKTNLDLPLSGGVGFHDGSLFVGAANGFVLRLDAANGSELWRTSVSGEVLSAPQGNGDLVAAQTYDGKLIAFDYETGERRWAHLSDVPVLTLRGTSTPIILGQLVIAGFADGKVLAIDQNSGNVAWEARIAIPQGRSEIERIVDIDGSMTLQGAELYVASYQGRVAAVDPRTGRKIWQRNVSSVSGVSVGFGNVYTADQDGRFPLSCVTGRESGGKILSWDIGVCRARRLCRVIWRWWTSRAIYTFSLKLTVRYWDARVLTATVRAPI
jgi:outer membrane protein assembly factor BamB